MAWKKNSPEAVKRFDALAAVPGAERDLMFGCPVWSLNGERYALLHQERLVLRLSPKDSARLISEGGKPWEPMKGRASKDKLVVPEELAADERAVRIWIRKAAKYAGSP